MKTLLIFLILSLYVTDTIAQDEKSNSIGINFITLPLKNSYSFVEYEHFFGDHASISARLGYLKYKYEESETDYSYTEEGSGPGGGASFRWHFGSKPAMGFFIGAGVEIVSTSWDWDELDYGYEYSGSGSSISIAPHTQFGYRVNIGSTLFITPSVFLGYFVSSEAEVGAFISPSLNFGLRF